MPFCERCKGLPLPGEPEPSSNLIADHPDFLFLRGSSRQCQLCKLLLDTFLATGATRRGQRQDVAARLEAGEHTTVSLATPQVLQSGHPSYSKNPVNLDRELAYRQLEVSCKDRLWVSEGVVFCTQKSVLAKRAIWNESGQIGFDSRLPVISEWLDDCAAKHTSCPTSIESLPTRIIDVGQPDGSSHPRLQDGNGRKLPYLALSHCWGSYLPFTTTKRTLAAREGGFFLEDLPRTYSDAIIITRRLKIRYLWIDSLCILQDDMTDWQRESANMNNIYMNSYATIAATAASDNHGGCLAPLAPALNIPLPGTAINNSLGVAKSSTQSIAIPLPPTTTYVRPHPNINRSITSSPLNQRAWVLQEMVLSRRIIHFTSDQLFWHCANRSTSEDGLIDNPRPTLHTDFSTPLTTRESWWNLVQNYTSRALTEPQDKCAALAGITRRFQSRTGDTPVAGLWRSDFHLGLLWLTTVPTARNGMGPSWSFFSIDGPVTPPTTNRSSRPAMRPLVFTPQADIMHAKVTWSGQELTSRITSGVVMMRGRLAKAIAVVDDRPLGPDLPPEFEPVHSFMLLSCVDDTAEVWKQCEGWCEFDSEPGVQQQPGARTVWCLQIATTQLQLESTYLRSKHDHDVLIVEATKKKDEYRRIGVGAIKVVTERNHPWVPDSQRTFGQADYFFGVEQSFIHLI